MLKKYIVFFAVAILFFYCKTVKNNVREHTYSETKTESITDEKKEITENIITTIYSDEVMNIIEEITRFSPPDETGKQYIVEVVKKQTGNDKKVNTEIVSNTEEKKETTVVETGEIKVETEKIDKTITKVKTPSVLLWSGIIVAVGIVIMIFLILKKYKLI